MAVQLEKVYNFKKFRPCFKVQLTNKDSDDGKHIAFTIHVRNKCLKSWHDLREKFPNIDLVQIINTFLAEQHVTLLTDKCARIEKYARALSSSAKSKLFRKKGRQFTNCSNLSRRINILESETIQSQNLKQIHSQKLELAEQYKAISERCEELTKCVKSIEEEKCKTEEKLAKQVDRNAEIERKNDQLIKLVERLEHLHETNLEKRGKKFSEVGSRQKRRLLKELKTKAERSFWFAKTFGLNITSIELQDDAGEIHEIRYTSTGEKGIKAYKKLTQEEKDIVKQVTFVTDKFCVGEAAYHEFTMTEAGADLPRSYLIKQCKSDLNNLVEIKKTPGEAEGAQLDFETELIGVLRNKVS